MVRGVPDDVVRLELDKLIAPPVVVSKDSRGSLAVGDATELPKDSLDNEYMLEEPISDLLPDETADSSAQLLEEPGPMLVAEFEGVFTDERSAERDSDDTPRGKAVETEPDKTLVVEAMLASVLKRDKLLEDTLAVEEAADDPESVLKFGWKTLATGPDKLLVFKAG